MPHCIIEYSQELEAYLTPATMLDSVYHAALDSGLFAADDIKVRAAAFTQYTSGQLQQNFVHVTVKILSGRTLEQRKKLSQLILEKLEKLLSSPISLTVEIVDLEKESYGKIIK